MTNPHDIIHLATSLASATNADANRQTAAKIIEAVTLAINDDSTTNSDILLAIAALITTHGQTAARSTGSSLSTSIAIIAGAVSILAQEVGQAVDFAPPPPGSPLN